MIGFILALIVTALVIGALGRLAIPVAGIIGRLRFGRPGERY